MVFKKVMIKSNIQFSLILLVFANPSERVNKRPRKRENPQLVKKQVITLVEQRVFL